MARRALLLTLWMCAPVPATAQSNELVDRLSERVDGRLLAHPDDPKLRDLPPARTHAVRATVTAAVLGAPGPETATIELTLEMPGAGPRLFLADTGVVWLSAEGGRYVVIPNQRAVLEGARQKVKLQALALAPEPPNGPPGATLTAASTNDPGLIAVLRTLHRIEAEDSKRAARYVREENGVFEVKTIVDNRDVELARWLTWSKTRFGRVAAQYPRDGLRFAILAVTRGFTIQETADWLRKHRKLDMNPAIARSWEVASTAEYLLERAGLNHRVFSPRHADYHFNQGAAAYARDDLPAALKAFKAAKGRANKMVDAQYNLAVVKYRMGEYKSADSELLVAGGLPNAGANVFYNRGAVRYRLGDKLGAARAFRKALERNPKDPQAAEWLKRADPDDVTKPKPKKRRRKRKRRGRRKR
jgi:hypothetical protein